MMATSLFVDNLERLLSLFDEVTGWSPPIKNALPNGLRRVQVEVAFINAAGLARHGVAGIAVGPRYCEDGIKSMAKYLQTDG